MKKLILSEKDYYDKVYACWLGKNCGGTLGTPLEAVYGQKELFDIWWYPELREGGMPNDDLELQLIWLKALEEKGLDIKAKDLSEYWLDCVGYNFDEYGLHKTSLKQGLVPPVSGYFNNWFKDCMGSPIRSEIWACISPGMPAVAARYAYEDAIVDHAGGESVYGEMFNAAIEAAAFVIDDRDKLLEIGLSYIPENCETAKAVRSAIEAYNKGLDWKEARNYVLDKCYSIVAQYSPVNLGFQTIGWLYGTDFGDAICKAVNCGYDTDCTGATLGSILGIMYGTKYIPEKWSAPLSDKITTNSSWGGIMNIEEPENLDELTRHTCAMGKRVLAHNNAHIEIGDVTDLEGADEKCVYIPDDVKALWYVSATEVEYKLNNIDVAVDYIDQPVIKAGAAKKIKVTVKNTRRSIVNAALYLGMPETWECEPCSEDISLKPGEKKTIEFDITVDDVKYIEQSNRLDLFVETCGRPANQSIPVVLLGYRRWLVSEVNASYSDISEIQNDLGNWKIADFTDNELLTEQFFNGRPGVLHLAHYVYSNEEKAVQVGASSNCLMEMHLNGEKVHEVNTMGRPRPNYAGDGLSYKNVSLKKGWNEFIIKFERLDDPAKTHFVLSTQKPYFHGLYDVRENILPREE